jgi:hypothetical protein
MYITALEAINQALDAEGDELEFEWTAELDAGLTHFCVDLYDDAGSTRVFWGIDEEGESNEDGQLPQWMIRLTNVPKGE